MRQKLEFQDTGLLDDEDYLYGVESLAADLSSRIPLVGGFLREIMDPPSLNEPDATGLVIGPQRQRNFERFFKDSVVRDEDGEPVVVYHGTMNEFNKFDDAKLQSGSNADTQG